MFPISINGIIISPFAQTKDFKVILDSLLPLTFHIPSILSSISSTFKIYLGSNYFSPHLSFPLSSSHYPFLRWLQHRPFSQLLLLFYLPSILHWPGRTHKSVHIIPVYGPSVMSYYTQNKVHIQTMEDKTIHDLAFASLYNLPLASLAITWTPETCSYIWAFTFSASSAYNTLHVRPLLGLFTHMSLC